MPALHSHFSAPGVVMAVGNTGEFLDTSSDVSCTFLSRDGGETWSAIISCSHWTKHISSETPSHCHWDVSTERFFEQSSYVRSLPLNRQSLATYVSTAARTNFSRLCLMILFGIHAILLCMRLIGQESETPYELCNLPDESWSDAVQLVCQEINWKIRHIKLFLSGYHALFASHLPDVCLVLALAIHSSLKQSCYLCIGSRYKRLMSRSLSVRAQYSSSPCQVLKCRTLKF